MFFTPIIRFLLLVIFVLGSVQQTKKCAGVTESEIDKSIQNWLKNSGDRLGGRDARRKHNQPCANPSTPEAPSVDTTD